ncbi:succinate dehydrogenase, cytochrome b556 subunit [Aliihoeflea aestuarii]|jgi:succinate dehydrogenase / fumarate reductase, cytochrome b subunit|uniref:succinate dehydrogenase, cytochrome b556 subunit n=1 Tax=Aliihoeflea aestuarii TaxID=453840 RepID=UPI00209223E0|nr:succinate dehydrogenase, cytochrome b556 subunit [Aliihoeflea aestuarii]MCO6391391.1 succinate dehydrogenase, cytochrome b556 subunit [Aliihoeflea aestuarii]
MSKTTATRARPLSPHLQVYTFIPTMMMSIIHRITGVGLYFGTVLVAIWLLAASGSPESFARVQAIYGSWFGLFVLFGYTWVLIHHLIGGVRHFVMDSGSDLALGKEQSTKAAIAMPFISAGITILIWIVALLSRGA